MKLENCLKEMKHCLKLPNVENCVCFSDAFKVLNLEVFELYKRNDNLTDVNSKEKLTTLKKEIEEIKKNISQSEKECLGCNPCIASVVFGVYSDKLDELYKDNEL